MKRLFILALCSLFLVPLKAVDYCASSAFGYGANATGGGNATPTLVSSVSELKSALNKGKNKVIIITKSLTFTSMLSVQDGSNVTLMALPGVTLTSLQQDAATSGILYVKRFNNLIIRNITFIGPGAYDCDGNDLLCFEKVTNAWVDHCDFQDGCDGNFDNKSLTDNITVSWCRFHYLKAPKAGGSGGTDDHRFSNLIGSGSSDKPADGTYNITYGFCWWDQGCKQRMTRCRNCELHFLNCYWNSSVADYYVGPENAKCYFEGCTFSGKANSPTKIWSDSYSSSSPSYCTFVKCTGNLPSNTNPGVSAPTYAYDALSAAEAKNYVTNSSCGAGATMSVTESGKVSSSCDGGDTPPVPPVGPVSGDCCVDLSLGEAPTLSNTGIPAEFGLLSVEANMSKSTWEQGYLNLGGNADYITFDFSAYKTIIQSVSFDVTIPNWAADKNTIAYHWNSDSNTKYNISSSAKEIVQLTAPANAKSFTIQRSAGTGTRISEVCFKLVSTATGVEEVRKAKASGIKVIRNGQLLILRDGKTYNLLGTRVE